VPKASVIGVFLNPNSVSAEAQSDIVQNAGRTMDQQVRVLYAGSERDFEAAFATIVQTRSDALIVACGSTRILPEKRVIGFRKVQSRLPCKSRPYILSNDHRLLAGQSGRFAFAVR
jgi:hypothetical protein